MWMRTIMTNSQKSIYIKECYMFVNSGETYVNQEGNLPNLQDINGMFII